MKNVKVTIDQLLGAKMTLENAQNRGNIPTNHAISKNLSRVMAALDPFFKAQKEEPMCWHFWEQFGAEEPTEEQLEQGKDALKEYLLLEVDFDPYRLQLSRCSDQLGPLSKSRESLSEDDLAILNENFTLVLRDLDILTDEV